LAWNQARHECASELSRHWWRAGSSITATRMVVLGIDRAGTARIVKSTIKYQTRTD
jgi:hypothetical protein